LNDKVAMELAPQALQAKLRVFQIAHRLARHETVKRATQSIH